MDFSENFKLLDPNVVKTGKAVTLKYDSIGWIEQAFATTVENVNPFNVIVYSGDIKLSPEIDNWVRTVQLPDKNISVTLNYSRTLTNNLTSNVSVTLTPINTQTSETERLRRVRGRRQIEIENAVRTEEENSQELQLVQHHQLQLTPIPLLQQLKILIR